MKTRIILLSAALISVISCSESQNPISSGIIETGDSNTTTISGSDYTIIEGQFGENGGTDTIHFQPNQYKFHFFMLEENPNIGRWELSSSLKVFYETGIIVISLGKDIRYRILLFQ